jgi:hypothetical protein
MKEKLNVAFHTWSQLICMSHSLFKSNIYLTAQRYSSFVPYFLWEFSESEAIQLRLESHEVTERRVACEPHSTCDPMPIWNIAWIDMAKHK